MNDSDLSTAARVGRRRPLGDPSPPDHRPVLGSHLFNVPDDDLLGAWLATCRRHVAGSGSVLIEHHPPSWFEMVADGERHSRLLIRRPPRLFTLPAGR